MQQRDMSNPTSWKYQAAIHGLRPEGQKPGEWDQCQHQTWFFLPWHRGYLHWFEDIVRAAIAELHGPSDWALPYWNYSDVKRPDALVMPVAFRDGKMPDGTDNPLFLDHREPHVNAGDPIGPADDVNVDALDIPFFVAQPPGGSGGFGGPQTGFHHGGGRFGELELKPHGLVHVDIGGWMGDPATAALDPIFWLHHANIDRLWEIWRTTAGHDNPTSSSWLAEPFSLHDANGQPVTFSAADMLDTTSPLLSYKYDTLTDPRTGVPVQGIADGVEPTAAMPDSQTVPEMVGATTGSIDLGPTSTSAILSISQPSGPAREALLTDSLPDPKVFLNVANVTGSEASTNYDVYLNLPENADPGADRNRFADHHVGALTTFGVERATSREAEHGGSGLHMSFDISDLVRRQQADRTWKPESLRVTFVPRKTDEALPTVKVGQVSLHYAP